MTRQQVFERIIKSPVVVQERLHREYTTLENYYGVGNVPDDIVVPLLDWRSNRYESPILENLQALGQIDVFDDYIYSTCHGIVYHITTEEHLDNILQSGLRCKNHVGREYPDRIYVYATEPVKFFKVKEALHHLAATVVPKGKKPVALKLRLNARHGPTFYRDSAMGGQHEFFTYTNIPAGAIEKVIYNI